MSIATKNKTELTIIWAHDSSSQPETVTIERNRHCLYFESGAWTQPVTGANLRELKAWIKEHGGRIV